MNFFFQAIQAKKMSFLIFQNETPPFQAIKTRSSKRRKNNIFSKELAHGFRPKMAIFPAFFYLGNKRQKNIFYDILERKSVFLEKKTKKMTFSKVVNPWFWSKNGHFLNFLFLAIIGQEMSVMIFYNEKMPFQAIKTRSSKSRKIDIFPNGLTHGFGRKMAIFPTLFFKQYRPGKFLL